MQGLIESDASQKAEHGPYYPYNDAETKAAAERGRAKKLGLTREETQAVIGLLLLGRADIAQKFEDAALMAQTCDAASLECYDINSPYGDWYAALMDMYRRYGFTKDIEPSEMVEYLTGRRMWGQGRPNGPRRGEPDRLDWQRVRLFAEVAIGMMSRYTDDSEIRLTNHLIEEANGCAYRRDLLLMPEPKTEEEDSE